MQTLQVEDITTGRDKRRLYRSVEAAAALAACGFSIRHKEQEIPSQGRREGLWFVDSRVDEAHALLLRCAVPQGPEALVERSPEDPFLAALWGIRSMRVIYQWVWHGGESPAALKPSPAGRLCCLQTRAPEAANLVPLLWSVLRPSVHVDLLEPQHVAFCAAAAVCGFVPHPRLTGAEVPQMHFAADSFTFAGLKLEHFHQQEVPGAKSDGRHVFSYALTGALALQKFEAHLARRKTFLLQGKYNPAKTAVIDSEILKESNGDMRAAREQVEAHLASV